MRTLKTGDLVTGILRRDWLGEVLEVEGADGADGGRFMVRWLKPADVWPNPRLELGVFLVRAPGTNPNLKAISGGADLCEIRSSAMVLAPDYAATQASVKQSEFLCRTAAALCAATRELRAEAQQVRHDLARMRRAPRSAWPPAERREA